MRVHAHRCFGSLCRIESSVASKPMSSSLSASSSTSSSSSFTLSSLNRSSRSSSRPGVPTTTCAPSSRSRAMSAWMLVPPTSNASVVPLHSAQSFCATECTCPNASALSARAGRTIRKRVTKRFPRTHTACGKRMYGRRHEAAFG
eukprot:2120114-Pleurochrysis_carterae.AAC.2